MKVLLIGGYGVFGERLARLLLRDDHVVCIAGRNLVTAEALARALSANARQVDRTGPLDLLSEYDVVIDAAGPFHTYGDDPYRLPRQAIEAGVHYLDLSDNAAFCAGINVLDAQAKAAGVCVLSGLSTVPALSSAVVQDLAKDARPEVIETAVLPGNRSPRGMSVMQSILAQAGRPMQVWRGGRWTETYGWSGPSDYQLPDGVTRQGWLIEVPDLALFPTHFKAGSVIFRAGLELGIMRYGLAIFGLIRRMLPFPVNRPVVRGFKVIADLLTPFGTGRGGMSVMVATETERRYWTLLAEDGDGPFIPGIAARALLRRGGLPSGAGAALGVVSLSEAEAAMSDLAVKTERRTEAHIPLFPRVLGPEFQKLPDPIRQTHLTLDQSRWQGRAEVTRGAALWSRLIAVLFRFPPANPDVDVEVVKSVTQHGEIWVRSFGKRRFRSHLAASSKGMTERFGPLTFALGLEVREGRLYYPVRAGRMGPIPLPKWLLPISEAVEYVDERRFHFDVTLRAPLTHALIVRYRGWLKADAG